MAFCVAGNDEPVADGDAAAKEGEAEGLRCSGPSRSAAPWDAG